MVFLPESGKEFLDRLAAQVVQEKKIPGFLFGVTSVEEELYLKTWGHNVVNDEESGKINEDSVFWMCGQSKLIVHIAGLQLVEQGKITLETPISEYLPEFSNLVIVDNQMAEVLTYKPAKTIMRYKHILDYTSGLYYPSKEVRPDRLNEAYIASHDLEDPVSRFISIIKGDLPGIPVLFEPGANWSNGWGSDIIGFVIERVTGQSLEKYLQDKVFKPLGMMASFYLTPDIKETLVDLTYRRGDKFERWANQSKIIEQDPAKVACHMGGDGLYASLKGYLQLLRHLLQIKSGKIPKGIISAESVRSLFEPALHETASRSLSRLLTLDPCMPTGAVAQWGTAFGLTDTDWPGRRKKGSGFWWGWAHTFFHIDPTTGVASVFGTQVIPMPDKEVFEIVARFEKVLYAELVE